MDNRSASFGNPDTRYKFTGKERDVETGYDYFGARYYDSRIGRFMALDRFAEKFPNLSTYQYAANNPILFIDVNGDSVSVKNPRDQNDIKNSLPKDLREFVQFDERGMLNVDVLRQQQSTDINFNALLALGGVEQIIVLHGADKLKYKDLNGRIIQEDMGTGFTGFTTAPDNSGYSSIFEGKLDVQINQRLSAEKRAKAVAHELYGHAQFYIEGKDWLHSYPKSGGGADQNKALMRAILRFESQAVKNFRGR